MPIPVACRCGKSFAANDNLAGKTVRCPGCQQPLTIPAPGQQGAAAQPAATTTNGKIVVACACGAKFAAGAELTGKQVKCPKCGQPLTVGAAPGPAAAATSQPAPAQAAGGMIPVHCQCGAKFGAKPELQGKTVKCPKCSQSLVIGAGAPAAAAQTVATAASVGGGMGLDDLFDDIGLKPKAVGQEACPECGAAMTPEAVICIQCGFNRQTGKKLEVQTRKKVETKKLGPPSAAAKAGAASKQPSASSSKPYNPAAQLNALDYLFVLLCGLIALVVSIVYIAQGNPKGKPMLIAWLVIQLVIPALIGTVVGVVLGVMQVTAS